ncbi:MAG: alpha/beta fold hydrolase [Myxococcota bacterium]|nr:alpha/beta fold hydrolase [Myxococcota bacterium]MDW8364101.1 YqiA/YcfP family alpha/beta fold hydrolase [Myxococcales bacterium]
MTRFAYLHGLGSGPDSHKGATLAARARARGLPALRRPDLNVPSFARLSPIAALDALDAMGGAERTEERWCLVGSSFGGWLAALWASRRPDRVERLVLLCPAFAIGERWPRWLGEAAMEAWRREGARPIADARGTLVPVHYALFEECSRLPQWPDVSQPTVIVHGRRDDVVPIESSRRYADGRPNVRLVEVDDDHALASSLDVIEAVLWGPSSAV